MFGRTIRKIGVIGSGNIGPDIALHFSQNLQGYGVPVVVVDILQAALDSGQKKAESKILKAVEKKVLKKDEADAVFANIRFSTDYGQLSDADFVIEAAFERTDVKHKIFAQCQEVCPKTAIFASNSSHMVPEKIFKNMKNKSQCLVIHYFFPAEGKPVVCAMNGLAFGGGNELAMACSARIARKGLKVFVAQPEPRLGIIPGAGGTQRFPRLVGIEKAWPILRTGNPISSTQAKEIGLILEEVEGDLVEAAMTLIKKILTGEVRVSSIAKGPIPIPAKLPDVDIGHLSRKIDSLLQKAILEGAKKTLEEGLKLEAKTFGECLLTQDMKIGMDNFVKNGPRVNANFVHA
jgi:enoyl-CoA hydratase/carnithine racemase